MRGSRKKFKTIIKRMILRKKRKN